MTHIRQSKAKFQSNDKKRKPELTMSLIVAYDANRGIGKANKLPWHCSADMLHFQKVTMGKVLVMGYNTYLSLGKKPLPGRTNVVLSESHNDIAEGFEHYSSLINVFANHRGEELICIGGAQTYKTCMRYVDRMYITEIDRSFNCDAHFDVQYDSYDFRAVNRHSVNCDKDLHCYIEWYELEKLY